MEKLLKISELEGLLELLKSNGEKIVFTNGCFDILHPGHIHYLQKAKQMGDLLIVGLNSDASVQRLKGTNRPVNKLTDRVTMLSALESVDFVIPFEEDTPIELIRNIAPDILVKGGDYSKEDIVGAELVEENGGKVAIIEFSDGYSTSLFIEKIKALNT
jgi:D-beta-D-heptose 7-phosphate kinase/D-beta-D-heptose 1-phosphate adenosyltransferase